MDTVKLDFKELLIKEQIDFKELFTDYQVFYTINLPVLLNRCIGCKQLYIIVMVVMVVTVVMIVIVVILIYMRK